MKQVETQLQKFSKVIFVFAKIGFIASIVGVCLTALASILMMSIGSTSLSVPLQSGKTIQIMVAQFGENDSIATVYGTLAYVFTYCIFMIAVMKILMHLFANMRDYYTPFTLENAALFKKIAIWMIVAAIVPTAVGQSVGKTYAVITSLPFEADYNSSFSLIAVLILFAMSMVFKYGCALQEEADTTL